MKIYLQELLNKYGLLDYTTFIIIIGFLSSYFIDFICKSSEFLLQKSLYYLEIRKELKKRL